MAEREGCLVCRAEAGGAGAAVGQFVVRRCGTCGFRWVDRATLDVLSSAVSFRDYPHNAILRRHFEEMKPLYLRGLEERVTRSLPGRDLGQRSFLDVGCANGEYLWAATTLGFGSVAGVEIDATAAERARAFAPVFGDLEALPPASFDIVQMKNVIANVREFRALLAKCVTLAKPGGALFIDAPNEDSLSAAWRRWLLALRLAAPSRYGYLCPPHVVNGFGRASIKLLVEQCGLTVTLLQTVWIGHRLAPYRPGTANPMTPLTRALTSRGALLILEAQRPPLPTS